HACFVLSPVLAYVFCVAVFILVSYIGIGSRPEPIDIHSLAHCEGDPCLSIVYAPDTALTRAIMGSLLSDIGWIVEGETEWEGVRGFATEEELQHHVTLGLFHQTPSLPHTQEYYAQHGVTQEEVSTPFIPTDYGIVFDYTAGPASHKDQVVFPSSLDYTLYFNTTVAWEELPTDPLAARARDPLVAEVGYEGLFRGQGLQLQRLVDRALVSILDPSASLDFNVTPYPMVPAASLSARIQAPTNLAVASCTCALCIVALLATGIAQRLPGLRRLGLSFGAYTRNWAATVCICSVCGGVLLYYAGVAMDTQPLVGMSPSLGIALCSLCLASYASMGLLICVLWPSLMTAVSLTLSMALGGLMVDSVYWAALHEGLFYDPSILGRIPQIIGVVLCPPIALLCAVQTLFGMMPESVWDSAEMMTFKIPFSALWTDFNEYVSSDILCYKGQTIEDPCVFHYLSLSVPVCAMLGQCIVCTVLAGYLSQVISRTSLGHRGLPLLYPLSPSYHRERRRRRAGTTSLSDYEEPVSVHSLHKTYTASRLTLRGRVRTSVHAVRGVSLDVHKGETLGLCGENAAGKTTLIGVLSGQLAPDTQETTHSSTTVCGCDVRCPYQAETLRHRIGLCPQGDTDVWPKLSVYDNILLAFQMRGTRNVLDAPEDKNTLHDRVVSLVASLRLSDVMHRKAARLSGGMRRRLALGIASAGGPEVCFLDEPSTGLDVATRRGVWQYIESLSLSGTSVLLTSHDADEVERLSQRVVVLTQGVVRDKGTPVSLRRKHGQFIVTVWGPEPESYTETVASCCHPVPVRSVLSSPHVSKIAIGDTPSRTVDRLTSRSLTATTQMAGPYPQDIKGPEVVLAALSRVASTLEAKGLEFVIERSPLEDVLVTLLEDGEALEEGASSIKKSASIHSGRRDRASTPLMPDTSECGTGHGSVYTSKGSTSTLGSWEDGATGSEASPLPRPSVYVSMGSKGRALFQRCREVVGCSSGWVWCIGCLIASALMMDFVSPLLSGAASNVFELHREAVAQTCSLCCTSIYPTLSVEEALAKCDLETPDQCYGQDDWHIDFDLWSPCAADALYRGGAAIKIGEYQLNDPLAWNDEFGYSTKGKDAIGVIDSTDGTHALGEIAAGKYGNWYKSHSGSIPTDYEEENREAFYDRTGLPDPYSADEAGTLFPFFDRTYYSQLSIDCWQQIFPCWNEAYGVLNNVAKVTGEPFSSSEYFENCRKTQYPYNEECYGKPYEYVTNSTLFTKTYSDSFELFDSVIDFQRHHTFSLPGYTADAYGWQGTLDFCAQAMPGATFEIKDWVDPMYGVESGYLPALAALDRLDGYVSAADPVPTNAALNYTLHSFIPLLGNQRPLAYNTASCDAWVENVQNLDDWNESYEQVEKRPMLQVWRAMPVGHVEKSAMNGVTSDLPDYPKPVLAGIANDMVARMDTAYIRSILNANSPGHGMDYAMSVTVAGFPFVTQPAVAQSSDSAISSLLSSLSSLLVPLIPLSASIRLALSLAKERETGRMTLLSGHGVTGLQNALVYLVHTLYIYAIPVLLVPLLGVALDLPFCSSSVPPIYEGIGPWLAGVLSMWVRLVGVLYVCLVAGCVLGWAAGLTLGSSNSAVVFTSMLLVVSLTLTVVSTDTTAFLCVLAIPYGASKLFMATVSAAASGWDTHSMAQVWDMLYLVVVGTTLAFIVGCVGEGLVLRRLQAACRRLVSSLSVGKTSSYVPLSEKPLATVPSKPISPSTPYAVHAPVEEVVSPDGISLLDVSGMTYSYGGAGGVPAVCDMSLQIRQGEIVSLLGHNGAGKTTACLCIRGVLSPQSGTVHSHGLDISTHPDRVHERMCMVTQADVTWPSLSVRSHLHLICGLRGVGSSSSTYSTSGSTTVETGAEAAVRTVAAITNLTPHLDKPASALSGGTRRRLSLAMAVLGCPGLLICDECTTGLDPSTKRTVWQSILRVARGLAVLLTSHSMLEAEALSDRCVIMRQGRVVASGSVASLRRSIEAGPTVTFDIGDAATHTHTDVHESSMTEYATSLVSALSSSVCTPVSTAVRRGVLHCAMPHTVSLATLYTALGEDSVLSQAAWDLEWRRLEDLFIQIAEGH
ncbi:ABC transporter A, ABCA, partial [Kipferlia bialata]